MQQAFTEYDPGVILPSQYYAILKHRVLLEGERRLMFAVLEDGIQCYLKGSKLRGREERIRFAEAQDWINSTKENSPFAFEVLCDELGINAAAMRNALQKQRRFKNVRIGADADLRSIPLAAAQQ